MRTTEHAITLADVHKILSGEGGNDLERIVEGGKQVAMKVVGVAPGSTAARLGAENGDTIESINDLPLTSVAAAYHAADVAVKQQKIVIKGSRRGEPYTTVLTLRGAS